MKRILVLAAVILAACDKPGVAPGLDENFPQPPGVISGSVVYTGTARGDVVLFLFDSANLPPPDGTGSSAVAVARIPQPVLFASAGPGSVGPFSAPFTFTQVPTAAPANKKYRVRAFIDATHEFDPFFDFTQQPRAGDPYGGYGFIGTDGLPHESDIEVLPGAVVSGINVALIRDVPFDPPSFVIKDNLAVQLDPSMDQPVRLTLQTVQLTAQNASFRNPKFGVELDRGADGLRRSTAGDGLDDVFPKVFLKQIKTVDETGHSVDVDPANVVIVPCRVVPTAVLPMITALSPLADPVGASTLDVLIEPFAYLPSDLVHPLPKIPVGKYQIVVIEKTGQVWTLPNSLGDQARFGGTAYYSVSQAAAISVDTVAVPDGVVKGRVLFHGTDPTLKSGNVIVQAYLDDPANPPPPLGAAQPARVEIIPRSSNRIVDDGQGGFAVDYRIDGLVAPAKYFVKALADVDGNFSPINLLQTPTRRDLVGQTVDAQGRAQSVSVDHGEPTVSHDVEVFPLPDPMDPPAFEFDATQGAPRMPAEQVTPVRFGVVAKPLAFPVGDAATSQFTVRLVRDALGNTVDADHDGLPDVWPRAFLVRLDANDLTDLSQYKDQAGKVRTQVIPAAVDPTPFLQQLTASPTARIKATKLSIVARPAAVDVTTPSQPARMALSAAPGKYKLVLINDEGQIWQVPNEAAPQALDPRAVCAANASTCPSGTVQTQSQGQAFVVLPPNPNAPAGKITVTLDASAISAFTSAYVFAWQGAPPEGQLVAADTHLAVEFVSGKATFTLNGLGAGTYYVSALVDTTGGFAASPQLYAAAPPAGTAAVSPVTAQPGATLTLTASATAVLPPRPSFVVQGASSDVPLFTQTGASPARMTLVATAVPGMPAEAGTRGFPVSWKACAGATPLDADGDGMPDVYPQIRLVKTLASDPTGLTPEIDVEGNLTIIPAAVDPSPYVHSMACNAAPVMAPSVDVVAAPQALKLNAFTHVPAAQYAAVPAGRYQVVLVSSTGQVWRVPNELQPALLDVSATGGQVTAAAPQGVAASVAAVNPLPTGSITGSLVFNGYSGAPGTVLVLAYRVSDPPPPLGGTGRPVRAQLYHPTGTSLTYTLPALGDDSYYVAALLDGANVTSPLLSYLASPAKGAQATFYTAGGTTPVSVSVSGGALVSGKDLAFVAGNSVEPPIPTERPAFTIKAGTGTLGGADQAVELDAADLTGYLMYAPAPIMLPQLTSTGAKDLNGYFIVNTRVLFTPDDVGQTCAPIGQIDNHAYCTLFTGTADCTAAPNQANAVGAPLTFTVPANLCVSLTTGTVQAARPSAGKWRVTVLENASGQAWSLPNELAYAGGAALAQGAAFIVQ